MSNETLRSLIVTDPSLLDESIDVSGLRTQTDTDPRLLASIADFPGISYDPTSFDYLSDLNELFAYGLPLVDTQAATPPVTGTPDSGSGGGGSGSGSQVTVPGGVNTLVTPTNTAEEQRLIDAGIGVQGAIGDPVVSTYERPVTQAELDEFNQRPVAPLSQPIDPTGMLPQTRDSVILPRQTSLQDELGIKGDIGVEGEDPGRFTATPPTGDVFAAGDYSDVAGTLADPREKLDVITAEDAADPDGLLAKLGITGFNAQEAAVKAAINKAVGRPVTLLIDALKEIVPPQDPRQTALDELYPDRTSAGTIASGLMKGYNPVSGGALNFLTGGKLGEPTKFGLEEAYNTRIANVRETLSRQYGFTKEELDQIEAGNITPKILATGFNDELGRTTTNIQKLADLAAGKKAEELALRGATSLVTGDIDADPTGDASIAETLAARDRLNLIDDIGVEGEDEDRFIDRVGGGVDQGAVELGEMDTTAPLLDIDTGVGEFVTDPVFDDDQLTFVDTTPDDTVTPLEDDFKTLVDTERTKRQEVIKNRDDRIVEEVANIADRQPNVVEQKKNQLANIYDRQVARGERESTPTITSKTNKAKAAIGMPQMLGDVGGGDKGGGGGGGKIVCTMMNESYGFGSFRNKIWLRHSKNLAPEYQIGYHKIFLPLVKLSKKNIVLKKVLEHIAVHRTIDIRQESRGKIHVLGRIYRKILEPICYWVGKNAKR